MAGIFREIKRFFQTDLSTKYERNFNPEKLASQSGEDGIIAEIMHRLSVERGWFVEFGAWDGVRFSNTYSLVLNQWNGVYIECDSERFKELTQNMRPYPGIHNLCRYVSLDGANSLDTILAETPIPRDFDLLSIDTDGNDYWVWKSLVYYKPKVLVIEYNSNFGPDEAKTIKYDPNHRWDETMYYGASAAALTNLAKAKGYSLVGYTPKLNLFYVADEFIDGRFKVIDVKRVPVGTTHRQVRRNEFVDV